ncbi:hypothetical protein [Acinetobacter sp. YH12147]|uniref:hypothetical protein n=1 Tax=Acinetobacter sp. YH12147 TaxID=2601130 RepID=UPI0015D37316|nr:hypothetical protein [Acinetobacter sp. YH12147]
MKKLILVAATTVTTFTFAQTSIVPITADIKKIEEIITTEKLTNHKLIETYNNGTVYKSVNFIPEIDYVKSEGEFNKVTHKMETFKTPVAYSKYVHPTNSAESSYGIQFYSALLHKYVSI